MSGSARFRRAHRLPGAEPMTTVRAHSGGVSGTKSGWSSLHDPRACRRGNRPTTVRHSGRAEGQGRLPVREDHHDVRTGPSPQRLGEARAQIRTPASHQGDSLGTAQRVHDPGGRVARQDGDQVTAAAHGTGDRGGLKERAAQFGVTDRTRGVDDHGDPGRSAAEARQNGAGHPGRAPGRAAVAVVLAGTGPRGRREAEPLTAVRPGRWGPDHESHRARTVTAPGVVPGQGDGQPGAQQPVRSDSRQVPDAGDRPGSGP